MAMRRLYTPISTNEMEPLLRPPTPVYTPAGAGAVEVKALGNSLNLDSPEAPTPKAKPLQWPKRARRSIIPAPRKFTFSDEHISKSNGWPYCRLARRQMFIESPVAENKAKNHKFDSRMLKNFGYKGTPPPFC